MVSLFKCSATLLRRKTNNLVRLVMVRCVFLLTRRYVRGRSEFGGDQKVEMKADSR